MQSKCANGSYKTPHHTTWLTNAFERRPKSSQSLGINWQLVGQQTHQAMLLSKAPGVDGNWLPVASNKPLHIHPSPKTSLNLYFHLFLCFSSNKFTEISQHNQLHSRATDRLTGWRTSGHQVSVCDDTQSWRSTKYICVNIRHAMKSSQCCTILDKDRNSAENSAFDAVSAFGLLEMSNQAVHSIWIQQKGVKHLKWRNCRCHLWRLSGRESEPCRCVLV